MEENQRIEQRRQRITAMGQPQQRQGDQNRRHLHQPWCDRRADGAVDQRGQQQQGDNGQQQRVREAGITNVPSD